MRAYVLLAVISCVALLPQSALAAVSFKTFTNQLLSFGNTIVVPLLFAFAFLFFLYGVFKYFILGGDSDKGREEGRTFILWSIVALALMLSAWGLVRVFMNTFGL